MYGRSELRGRETEDSATKRNYNIHEREKGTDEKRVSGGRRARERRTETEILKESCGRVSPFYRP